jgi:SAM-dependent methyltransferase
MYKRIVDQTRGLNLGSEVLSISHSRLLCSRLGVLDRYIREANYPDVSLQDTRLPSNSCSAVVSDQVLEHISCLPNEAVAEVLRVLRPGGIAIHTTCFLTPYHGSVDFSDQSNGDYWRFTPSGLARLHKDYSRVIAADGWGNPFMSIVTAFGLGHVAVPELRWHPINMLARLDRRSYAFVVWVIAQK